MRLESKAWAICIGVGIISALSVLASCGRQTGDYNSEVKTDLGPTGNYEVLKAFKLHKSETGKVCNRSLTGKRVMVTGFGLFSGVSYNISGVVTSSMADAAFWPDDGNGTEETSVASGTLTAADNGVRIQSRTLDIDGVRHNICFLLLDVKWDLAAAIIAYQASLFKPAAILMTGRGGESHTGIFEGGAINNATRSSGYDADGARDPDNTPIRKHIIPSQTLDTTIKMTWTNTALSSVANKILEGSTWRTRAEPSARASNNYICNNVSYVLLNAARGKKFTLAGTRLGFNGGGQAINPDITWSGASGTSIGFLHLPAAATNKATTVRLWAAVVEATIAEIAEGISEIHP